MIIPYLWDFSPHCFENSFKPSPLALVNIVEINEYLLIERMLFLTAATAKSLQSCPTLCDPIPGILQARTLEWVAISFSNA